MLIGTKRATGRSSILPAMASRSNGSTISFGVTVRYRPQRLLVKILSHETRKDKNRNALESLGYPLPGWDFDDAVGRHEGAVMDWARMLAYSLGRWTKNCWRGMNI
jgi:hypothetical protein